MKSTHRTMNTNTLGERVWPGGLSAKTLTAAVLMAAVVASPLALAQKTVGFFAGMKSTSEVPANITDGLGAFQATLSPDGGTLTYSLLYFNLEGSVTQSHIHIGNEGTNGGIVLFLCSNAPPQGVTTPACPASGASPVVVSGTLTAANLQTVAGQGVTSGKFSDVIDAMRHGAAYANVHSDSFPAGEIRGQIISGP